MLVAGMRVLAGGVGLPDLDQGAGERAIGLVDRVRDHDPLAEGSPAWRDVRSASAATGCSPKTGAGEVVELLGQRQHCPRRGALATRRSGNPTETGLGHALGHKPAQRREPAPVGAGVTLR